MVQIGTEELSCHDPSEHVGLCEYGHVRFELPAFAQQPGVYWLEDLDGFFIESAPDEGDGFCGGGGGAYEEGQVEIIAIDEERIVGILRGGESSLYDYNGHFIAPRCPLK